MAGYTRIECNVPEHGWQSTRRSGKIRILQFSSILSVPILMVPQVIVRAKLRLIAIEHMCLAKGGTKNECEKEKELEAAKISMSKFRNKRKKQKHSKH